MSESRVKHKGKYYKIDVDCVFEKTREGMIGNWEVAKEMCEFYQPLFSTRIVCKHAYFTRLRKTWKPIKCHDRRRKKAQIRDYEIAVALEEV